MGYERRPFQPTTPYPNQVATELNKANDNFDLLARAFVGDNPATLKVKNALNSDTVGGFRASQTPTANTIPVALATGKLDIGWLPDGIGGHGYRRVDLTNATTDYNLQLGEEAYYVWDTSTRTSLPLRIQVSGSLYQMFVVSQQYTTLSNIRLSPNNTTYSSAFSARWFGANPSPNSIFAVYSSIYISTGTAFSVSYLQTTTQSKIAWSFTCNYSPDNHVYFLSIRWDDRTTVWSSLGMLTRDVSIGTVHVLVRRIL